MKRKRIIRKKAKDTGGLYFEPTKRVETFSSGCALLDCALGGGWAYERISNIVGDKSTGKTLLAIEAAANFSRKNRDAQVFYIESEAAFDKDYAQALGLPRENLVLEEDLFTIEDVFEQLTEILKANTGERTLYIIDSLDALSDRAEAKRKIDDGSYGMTKQKKLSELFRRMTRDFKNSMVTLMIVSQIRDKIGAIFGKKHARSGGKSLDFYASQVLWLAHLGRLERTRRGVKRPIGVQVRGKIEKNKVGMPFREALFPIHFAYGIEDLISGIDWLKEVKRLDEIGLNETSAKKMLRQIPGMSGREYRRERINVAKAVRRVWRQIEKDFTPTRRKYE